MRPNRNRWLDRAAERGPAEDWQAANRSDYGFEVILRIYLSDLVQYEFWASPNVERVTC